MKDFFRSPSLFFAAPLLLGCLITAISYQPPAMYTLGLAFFLLVSLLAIGFDRVSGVRLPPRHVIRDADFVGTRESFVALCIGWVILLFCVIDLTLFPIPLIHDPTSYATFSGARLHVRHISNMCWMLPVIGLLCTRNLKLRILLIGMGLAFPVLVLDRNRLFAVAFSCIVLMMLRRRRAIPWKTVGTLGVAAIVAFGVLGTYRSGNLAWVPLPFSPIFDGAPTVLKWLLLYASAGIYNFSAIMTKGYHNAEFLVNQLVPGAGSVATLGTDIPLDAPTINIGTEFFPFLMALGPAGAFVAAMLLYLMVLGAFLLLRARLSVFTLLVFLRITYVSVMSSFAPQAYTWTNFGVIGLCLFAMVLASLLPRRAQRRSATLD